MAETHWAVSLIVAFVPLFLFCFAVAWHARQLRKSLTTQDGRSLAQVFDDLAREVKKAPIFDPPTRIEISKHLLC